MTRCPIHPAFFRTENTPCPACREEFNENLPLKTPQEMQQMFEQAQAAKYPPAVSPAPLEKYPRDLSTWHKTKPDQQCQQIDELNDQLYAAHERNVIYAAVAVIGWAVVIIAGTLSVLGWVQL